MNDTLTPKQADFLARNPHLLFLSRLDDGDALVADTVPAPNLPVKHFGPYVLAQDGRLQDVNYHYAAEHSLHLPH